MQLNPNFATRFNRHTYWRLVLLLASMILVLSIAFSWIAYSGIGLTLKYEIQEGNLPSYMDNPIQEIPQGSHQYNILLQQEKERLEFRLSIIPFWTPFALALLLLLLLLNKRMTEKLELQSQTSSTSQPQDKSLHIKTNNQNY